MSLENYCFDGKKQINFNELPTNSKKDRVEKSQILEKTAENLKKIEVLQDRLYAYGKESLVIILQAMDAAGKDSTIKHVMSGLNPQGVDVHSFKQPSSEELSHDFLWRAVKALPSRGKMAIFNRSYYEDVLIVKIHELYKNYQMASRCLEEADFFQKRYQHIRNFEEYLYDNSYRVIKIFLNVSKEEQKKRFLDRINIKSKNWKFSDSDIRERKLWDDYMEAYTDAINHTAAKHAPWYVFPADQKWYTRYLVSEAVLAALEEINPDYPSLDNEDTAKLLHCKELLEQE